jgi:hypothetical protein
MRARETGRTRRTRLRTAAAAGTTATALVATLSGCVTVDGEAAVIPAVSKGEAAKVLRHFTTTSNKANRNNDPGLNGTIESGPLGAIDQAGLKARRKVSPEGNKQYEPLELTDTRFLIPKQAGWPKFFVADTLSNRGDDRWLLIFARSSADSRWKASYLSVLDSDELPDFATDGRGHAKAVPRGGGSGLVVPPGELSQAYVRYLKDGEGEFADGKQTSARRSARKGSAHETGRHTQFVDQPARPPQYAPFGLRTKDGGAVVFFGSLHHTKETYATGYHPPVKDPLAKALMSGKPKQSVIYSRTSQQAVTVPAKKDGGKIAFLNRIDGLTSAKGE